MTPLHFSALKHMGTSPAHYKWNASQPFRQTEAMRVGSAIDALVFGTCDVVLYAKARDERHNAYREFCEEHPDAIILSTKEYDVVHWSVNAIDDCPDAVNLLAGTQQSPLAWDINGRACEGTPDVYDVADARVVELKKTRCGDPRKFVWDAKKLCYHAQLDWYAHAIEQVERKPVAQHYIVTVETAAPFPVTIFQLTDRAVEIGRRTWASWMERLLVCEAADEWPAYSQSIVPLDFGDPDESFTLRIDGEDVEI